ncbi:pentapeptide repeat-containing protein [Candidatus Uabimicrobium amorphum]|uniref:Pentapeptide repeat-containing protein n=1 Tax=Uabimicrobium amorphum TaxID=2596890 RepID=A0A5S9IPF3_UABAM|nr:pentapeptide repeat-containing protein [Candidatus Uabimicrobium amorphum]BBM84265.1 hypothetical protein UABAM_02622 [Candidatus Uabimicrobium amorphum]
MDIPTLIGIFTGALAVFIPAMAGLFQYRQSIQQRQDNNFRSEIEKLTSNNQEERLAAATNLGTFIIKGNRFYNEAIDILINRTSVELDYNVMGAMVASLRRVEKSEFRTIVQKLLDIDRNFFIRRYPLKKWRDQADKDLQQVENNFKQIEELNTKTPMEVYNTMLQNFKKEMGNKWEVFLQREKDFQELGMHTQAITDFISSFLCIVSKKVAITGLEFNQNSLNNAVMESANLHKCIIKASAFSASQIKATQITETSIFNTVFTFSGLSGSAFRNCPITSSLFDQTNLSSVNFQGSEFHDVFFVGSDLLGANFRGTKGLKVEYFYKARNLDRAIFDKAFAKELQQKLPTIDEKAFSQSVNASSLTNQRVDALFLTLKELKDKGL